MLTTTCPLCGIPKPEYEFGPTYCKDCESMQDAIVDIGGDNQEKRTIAASVCRWYNKVNGLCGFEIDPKYNLYLRRYGVMVQGKKNELLGETQ